MKKVLLSLLVLGMMTLAPEVRAQTDAPAPVGYSERVPAENLDNTTLYRRALDWAQNRFSYGPKSGMKVDESAGTVRVTGTGKVKQVDTKGKEQEVPVLFDFSFRATGTGYEYSIGSFRVVPDTKQPSQTVPFDQYRTQLQEEKNNDKTRNDRRITAQATSLASEAAMSFRSYMNSTPAEGQVGVAGGEN